MKKIMGLGLLVMVSMFAVACGDDDESAEGDSQALSEAICAEQKECQYLLLDETTCAELFAGFFDAAELAACRECQEAEECDAQQEACSSVCSMQNN